MKQLTQEQRKSRIIARGEVSGHSHVITGVCDVRNEDGQIMIDVFSDGEAIIKHLIEEEWMKGKEIWTKEHVDIPLKKGTYKFVQQQEFSPLNEIIQSVKD